MKYIHIDLIHFNLNVAPNPIDPNCHFFSIKSRGPNLDYHYQYLSNKILLEILYPERFELDKQLSLATSKTTKTPKVAHKLMPPPPWLVAVCSIMWQGVIQGLTWDLIKHSVLSSLSKLKKENLVPLRYNYKKVYKSKKIGFIYEKHSDEKILESYFIGLKSSYKEEVNTSRNSLKKKCK